MFGIDPSHTPPHCGAVGIMGPCALLLEMSVCVSVIMTFKQCDGRVISDDDWDKGKRSEWNPKWTLMGDLEW